MQVALKPGAWVDPPKMMKAVYNSGFTAVPEEVRFVVTGALEARDGAYVLVLDGMKEPLTLTCVATGADDAVAGALAGGAGKAVTITGRWQFEGQGSLLVEEVAAPPAAP